MINKAKSIYIKNIKQLLILSIMIVLPVALFEELVLSKYQIDTTTLISDKLVVYLLVSLVLSEILIIYRITVIRLAFDDLLAEKRGISGLFDFSLRVWPKLFITELLLSLMIAIGFMLCVIPGIVIFVLSYYYIFIVVRDNVWGRKVFDASNAYARKNIALVIGFITISVILAFVFGSIDFAISFILKDFDIALSLANIVTYVILQLAAAFIDICIAVYLNDTKLEDEMPNDVNM